VHTYYVLICRS